MKGGRNRKGEGQKGGNREMREGEGMKVEGEDRSCFHKVTISTEYLQYSSSGHPPPTMWSGQTETWGRGGGKKRGWGVAVWGGGKQRGGGGGVDWWVASCTN